MMVTDIQESPRERFVGAWLDYSKEATLSNSDWKVDAFRMVMSCGGAKGKIGGPLTASVSEVNRSLEARAN
jgi:hypothetical protein